MQEGDIDAIVVECSGIAEPRQIAAAFETLQGDTTDVAATATAASDASDAGALLDRSESYLTATAGAPPVSANDTIVDVVRTGGLDTLVTVVDAESFLHHFESTTRVGENKEFIRGENASSEDMRHIVDLLIDQVEVADVIVLNKVDLVEVRSNVVASLSQRIYQKKNTGF